MPPKTARMCVTALTISPVPASPFVRIIAAPSTRMSAGTRSSAMTATAPASSAIAACSAVVTSMITPPFSISARPPLTRIVPSSAITAMLAVGAEAEMVDAAAVDAHRPTVEPVAPDEEIEEPLVPAGLDAARVSARAVLEPVRMRAATAVDDVAHAASHGGALLVVVVPGKDEPHAVPLEERNPASHDLRMRAVPAAGEGRMVQHGELPAGGRAAERP